MQRRLFVALWVATFALCIFAVSCADRSAATSRGELGSEPGEVGEPTPILEDTPEAEVIVAPTPTPEGPRPLVVATILGETGVLSPLDGSALAGVVAEIERLNEQDGVLGREIELVRYNNDSRVSLAERTVLRLIENPPDLLVVSCDTDFSAPVLDAADAAGILTISPCADDPRYLTGAFGPRNFTLGATAEPRGALAARVGMAQHGDTAIVLRDVTSPEALAFCDGFERAFRELGGTVVYRDEFSYDTLEPVQDRLAERGPASAFITVCSHVPGGLDAAPAIITFLRELGFTTPIVAGSTLDSPGWFAQVPSLGELTYISWSSIYGNDSDEAVNDIVRRAQQNGETPGAGVATILGAEAIIAYAQAVEAARDPAPDRVAAALASFSDETFATGELSFVTGARMDIGRTYRVLRVVDGELSVVGLESTPD